MDAPELVVSGASNKSANVLRGEDVEVKPWPEILPGDCASRMRLLASSSFREGSGRSASEGSGRSARRSAIEVRGRPEAGWVESVGDEPRKIRNKEKNIKKSKFLN